MDTADARAAATLAAARNNADWCATVCRTHGIPERFRDAAWTSDRRTPPYYPDAVTLRPDAMPEDVLPWIDTASPGCSVKDSFATLDLSGAGFTELFTARWIHRAAGTVPGRPAVPVESAADLAAWQAVWHGAGDPPDVFRTALLADPSVLVLAVPAGIGPAGIGPAGGAVLNRSASVVGLSNVFAADGVDPTTIWTAALVAAARFAPALPVVGYERGRDLETALSVGFVAAGDLRVWMRG